MINKEQQARLDEASCHDYYCTCDLCKEWWEVLGPEYPEDSDEDPWYEEEEAAF